MSSVLSLTPSLMKVAGPYAGSGWLAARAYKKKLDVVKRASLFEAERVMPSKRGEARGIGSIALARPTNGLMMALPSHRSFHSSGPPLRTEEKNKPLKKGIFYEMGIIFSKERREERAKKLKEEVSKGQFFEIKEMDKTGGKIFEADTTLRPASDAIVFPNVQCRNLDGDAVNMHDLLGGKVTLVTVGMREISRPMINTWNTHFHSKLGSTPGVQMVPLSFVEGWIYKLMAGPMLKGMKQKFPDEQRKGAVVAFESSVAFRKVFGMENRLVICPSITATSRERTAQR